VQTVIDLRHALLHYKPEWESRGRSDFQSRFNQLPRSRQLPSDAGFPNQILNADSANTAAVVRDGGVVACLRW
jgi:hypothetical protein